MDIDKLIEEKGNDYGKPEYFFSQLAEVWSAMTGKHIRPIECVAMMIAFKNIRLINNPELEDTYKDLLGYSTIAENLSKNLLRD